MIDLDMTPEESAFYQEALDWLRANLPRGAQPPAGSPEYAARSRAWDRALFDAGYGVLTWPRQWGGREASLRQWLLFEDAYYEVNGPYRLSQNGTALLAPAVMEHGTAEQQSRILLPMARGEVLWAQAWSEPGAGSDLASLTSRAVRVDGGYKLIGHKIWTSHAVSADMAFGLFRTGEPGGRHRGLTYFLVSLAAEGVTVTPIGRIDGRPTLSEVRFDEVFVADDAVLGEVGQGWRVAMATTSSERGFVMRSPGRFISGASRLLRILAKSGIPDRDHLADRVGQVWQDAQAYRYRVLGHAARLARGEQIGAEASFDKLFWSDLDIRMNEVALDILEAAETADGFLDDQHLAWIESYISALPGTIWGGTSEIQRNIVAQRLLALPRSY